ncbi:MAG TPA: EAL domain-containing protein [Geminicoccaceae bacterium]|nr:EAL domain-containing protein [Geminicoccus sp.]HMU48455.1 EAL domain-containing protein [Geminicoccaceae bacterium]
MSNGRWGAFWRYGPIVLALAVLFVGYVYFSQRLRTASDHLLSANNEAQWMAFQTEMELARLRLAAERYAFAIEPVGREAVIERVDLLRSRLPLLIEGADSALIRDASDVETLVPRLEAELGEVERLLRSQPPGPALGAAIDARLEPLAEPVREMVLAVLHASSTLHYEIQTGIERLAEGHWVALVSILIGLAMLVALLLREILRTQRLLREAALAERLAAELANHDALTGLPNRRLFQDRLDHALAVTRRRGGRLALHLIDLDRFKEVNDRHGHAAGDALLRAMAQRMVACLRAADTLARLGGDEFAILQLDIEGPGDVSALMARLDAAIRQPVDIGGAALRSTASIGTALSPGDGDDADTLLRHADVALYRAKSDGRDRQTFYVSDMDREEQARRRLLVDLEEAVRSDRLTLLHQLRFDAGGRPVAVEALVRWADPARGLVLPSDFLPLVEDSALIVALGAWVLETACRESAQWRRADGSPRVAVNIAGAQLLRDDLPARVERVLARHGLSPADLEIELPESAVAAIDPAMTARLETLRQRGVRILLDHFGTGHSSIGALRVLPVDGVKLAGSLAADVHLPRGAALYEGMIRLAHGMGLRVVGSGVETALQAEILRRLGCDELQGFHLAPPEAAGLLGRRLQLRPASAVSD